MGKTFRKERTKPKEHTKKPIKRCKGLIEDAVIELEEIYEDQVYQDLKDDTETM